jgi:hypothetical protein
MTKYKLRLSRDQIDEITSALHDLVQFYNPQGHPANKEVLRQIEDGLKAEFSFTLTADQLRPPAECPECIESQPG